MENFISRGSILADLLGANWPKTAAQIFSITPRMAHYLHHGTYPLTRRQVRILATYADQRRRARTQRKAQRLAALEREIQAEEMAAESGSQRLTAYIAERKRQGTI